MPSIHPEPVVYLANAFQAPFDNAMATARTCYAPKVITADDVGKDEKARAQRDLIAASIYKAGHHTTLQHATFQFVLDKVSRQFVWSFIHSHPFYNSEQVSQRYVRVALKNFIIPPLSGVAREIYLKVIRDQMLAYENLIAVLDPLAAREYKKIFQSRDLESKAVQLAVTRSAQEVARYVLPVATHTYLYHTVSGLTLHRYHRLSSQWDVPAEQRSVVDKMIQSVNAWDPLFFKNIEDPVPLENTIEYEFFESRGLLKDQSSREAFIKEFDTALGNRRSKLVAVTPQSLAVLGASVRAVLGVSSDSLTDDQAVEYLMDPGKNNLFSETLNLASLSKLMRTLNHVHFTFQKKISHTADSQDQRHRLTPASRPVLARQFVQERPDFIIPSLIKRSPEAFEIYHETMAEAWKGMSALLNAGVSDEFALYLLPNAFPIRFYESGDLAGFYHKWTKRLCMNAQEEIWQTSREEVAEVQRLLPELGCYLLPPCGIRKLGGAKPFCPEGERYCGVPVWQYDCLSLERTI